MCRCANEQKELKHFEQLPDITSFVLSDIAQKNLGKVSLKYEDLTWVSEKRFDKKLILSVVPLPRKNLDIVSLATKEMLMVPEKRYLLSDIHYMSSFCHP